MKKVHYDRKGTLIQVGDWVSYTPNNVEQHDLGQVMCVDHDTVQVKWGGNFMFHSMSCWLTVLRGTALTWHMLKQNNQIQSASFPSDLWAKQFKTVMSTAMDMRAAARAKRTFFTDL